MVEASLHEAKTWPTGRSPGIQRNGGEVETQHAGERTKEQAQKVQGKGSSKAAEIAGSKSNAIGGQCQRADTGVLATAT